MVVAKWLNGINPDNLLTLSTNQTIPATVHFENIEITERLLVERQIGLTAPVKQKCVLG